MVLSIASPPTPAVSPCNGARPGSFPIAPRAWQIGLLTMLTLVGALPPEPAARQDIPAAAAAGEGPIGPQDLHLAYDYGDHIMPSQDGEPPGGQEEEEVKDDDRYPGNERALSLVDSVPNASADPPRRAKTMTSKALGWVPP